MASSPDREAIARAGFEAFNAGDTERVLGLLSEDVEVFASPELANAGTFHGHDGYLAWVGPWVDAWRRIETEIDRTTSVGERHVVVEVRQTGHGREGIEVSMDVAFLFDLGEDGLVDYLALLPDADQALRSAREREAG